MHVYSSSFFTKKYLLCVFVSSNTLHFHLKIIVKINSNLFITLINSVYVTHFVIAFILSHDKSKSVSANFIHYSK